MHATSLFRPLVVLTLVAALAACGNRGNRGNDMTPIEDNVGIDKRLDPSHPAATQRSNTGLLEAFRPRQNENIVSVNRYIWNASLDVLNFLPIRTVDPFTGVIVTGYGTPPGGGRAYRATIHITDPALEARALKVALQTRGGPVSVGTQRAVEDAILARARQLRIADSRF